MGELATEECVGEVGDGIDGPAERVAVGEVAFGGEEEPEDRDKGRDDYVEDGVGDDLCTVEIKRAAEK